MKYFFRAYKDHLGNDCKSFYGKEEHGNMFGISSDENNIDTQAFLAWVAEGNTAEEWTGN